MPLYEYQCQKCGQVTERERKIGDRKKSPSCEKCGHPVTELIISRGSFALLGGGWANTGYAVKKGK